MTPTRSPAAPASRRVKSGLRLLVLIFSALCFIWVLWPVLSQFGQLRQRVPSSALLAWVGGGIVLYALISILLGLAWWWLSGVYGRRPTPTLGYAIWAKSQWAKYLPGNAFHYVSRQVLGRRVGLSHAALVASGLLELGSLLIAALIAGLAGAESGGEADLWSRGNWPWAVALAALALLAWPTADALLRRWRLGAKVLRDLPRLSLAQTWTLLAPSILLYVLFFLFTGALLYGLVMAGWSDATVDTRSMVSLFAVAWLAGTVTVGAPAGVGVREAILTLELGPLIGSGEAAVLALALRIVTTGGDCLSALLGWWWMRHQPEIPLDTGASVGQAGQASVNIYKS